MKSPIFIILTLLISVRVVAQETVKLSGRINLPQDTVYTIEIIPCDTIYKTVTFTSVEKDFSIDVKDIIGNVDLFISALDFSNYKTRLNISADKSNINLGEIVLSRNITLGEVTVKSGKPKLLRDGANYKVKNIHNSKIGQAGNYFDMLKFVPGVIVRAGTDISIMGKGSPIIYVNGKEIKNRSELSAYQSTDVSEIEVVRDLDASYSASASCAIKITTRQLYKNYLGANISNALNIRERVSDVSNASINLNKGIVSATAYLSYGRENTRFTDNSSTVITHSDNSTFTNLGSSLQQSSGNSINVFTGLNFDLKKAGKFGIQYAGNFIDSNNDQNRSQEITDAQGVINKNNVGKSDNKNNLHSVSASYVLVKPKGRVFSVIGDFANRHRTKDESLSEMVLSSSTSGKTTNSNSKYNYNIYTLTTEYKFNFGKKDSEKVGVNGGYIDVNGNNMINADNQLTTRKNYFISSYYTFQKTWSKYTLNLGIRYEFDNVKTDMSGIENICMEKSYSNLFPNAMLKYKFTDNMDLSLSYSRNIHRPSFNDLNPTVYYTDEYNYTTGNPNLKPRLTDRIGLQFNLSDLSLGLTYSEIKDDIQWVAITDGESSNVLAMKPVNIKNSHRFNLNAEYYWSKDWFDIYSEANLCLPNMSYPYLNRTITNKKLYCEVMAQLTFNVYKTLSLYLNGQYTSKNEDGPTVNGDSYCIDAGASMKFFKNKLYVSVDCSDLFRKSVTPHWESYYLNTYTSQNNRYDTRGVKLTLRWTFNNIQSKFINRRGNMESISRTM